MPNSEDYKPILGGAYVADGTSECEEGVVVEIYLTNARRVIVDVDKTLGRSFRIFYRTKDGMFNKAPCDPAFCGAFVRDGSGEGDDGVFVNIFLTDGRQIIVERTVKGKGLRPVDTYAVKVADLAGTKLEGPIEACQDEAAWDEYVCEQEK